MEFLWYTKNLQNTDFYTVKSLRIVFLKKEWPAFKHIECIIGCMRLISELIRLHARRKQLVKPHICFEAGPVH